MINQNNLNIWLWQPLLVAEIFMSNIFHGGVEFHQEGKNIEVAFQPMPMAEIMAPLQVAHDESDHTPSVKGETHQQPHHIWILCQYLSG